MAKKLFIISFTLSFICFLVFYIIGLTGYYDYKQHEKMVLTKENMKKFEDDVASGTKVDIKDYMKEETYDYNNGVSKMGMNISNQIEKYTKIVIGGMFKAFDKVVE